MEKHEFEFHVTLYEHSTKGHWFVVASTDGDGFDLLNEGLSASSSLPSVAAGSLSEWISERMAGR